MSRYVQPLKRILDCINYTNYEDDEEAMYKQMICMTQKELSIVFDFFDQALQEDIEFADAMSAKKVKAVIGRRILFNISPDIGVLVARINDLSIVKYMLKRYSSRISSIWDHYEDFSEEKLELVQKFIRNKEAKKIIRRRNLWKARFLPKIGKNMASIVAMYIL